jgi:hypothetical protein
MSITEIMSPTCKQINWTRISKSKPYIYKIVTSNSIYGALYNIFCFMTEFHWCPNWHIHNYSPSKDCGSLPLKAPTCCEHW